MSNLLSLLQRRKVAPDGLLTSTLFNERGFYRAFVNDLERCTNEVIIESPFLTSRRTTAHLSLLQKLTRRGVRVVINTRHPYEHEGRLQLEAERALAMLFDIGAEVFFTGGHHRKLAILDQHILWEGSLNILSQNDSCEIMRRIESVELTRQMMTFLGVKAMR
jgi:phosphatidylserine/phosphatidylglycerophosphate/cardiolipin synthase-like enzyme